MTADSPQPIDLVETMAFDPMEGIPLLERHLARMKASAADFGHGFDRHATRNELQAATFRLREAKRLRLLLAASGAVAIEVSPLPSTPHGPVPVRVVPLPLDPADPRLRHQTCDRDFHPPLGDAFELIYEAPDGTLASGSFTTPFVERDGMLLTPPAGPLVPGVLRAELIESGRAREAVLTRDDLAGGFLIGNALLGLLPAVVSDGAQAPAPL